MAPPATSRLLSASNAPVRICFAYEAVSENPAPVFTKTDPVSEALEGRGHESLTTSLESHKKRSEPGPYEAWSRLGPSPFEGLRDEVVSPSSSIHLAQAARTISWA